MTGSVVFVASHLYRVPGMTGYLAAIRRVLHFCVIGKRWLVRRPLLAAQRCACWPPTTFGEHSDTLKTVAIKSVQQSAALPIYRCGSLCFAFHLMLTVQHCVIRYTYTYALYKISRQTHTVGDFHRGPPGTRSYKQIGFCKFRNIGDMSETSFRFPCQCDVFGTQNGSYLDLFVSV